MARVKILKKDGTETPFFWLEKDKESRTKTVYKETPEGVKRMRGVRFNPTTNQMRAD
jgi:hypothetical protein